MRTILVMISILVFSASVSFAGAKIAFLEITDSHGQLVQLEPGGRYSHLAIFYAGGWLHSHPYRGVEITTMDELKKMSSKVTIVDYPDHREPSDSEVAKYIGKPYDHQYSWSDDKIYCSELIAKLMGLVPSPMFFSSPFWGSMFESMRGQNGISPDEVFKSRRMCLSFYQN